MLSEKFSMEYRWCDRRTIAKFLGKLYTFGLGRSGDSVWSSPWRGCPRRERGRRGRGHCHRGRICRRPPANDRERTRAFREGSSPFWKSSERPTGFEGEDSPRTSAVPSFSAPLFQTPTRSCSKPLSSSMKPSTDSKNRYFHRRLLLFTSFPREFYDISKGFSKRQKNPLFHRLDHDWFIAMEQKMLLFELMIWSRVLQGSEATGASRTWYSCL